MTDSTFDEQRARLQSYERGFFAVYLMRIGIDLGIFKKLSSLDKGISSSDLASELGLHEPYVRVWCQAGYHLAILEVDEASNFLLAPHVGPLLADTENPYYFGHTIDIRTRYMADHLLRHPEYYKSGNIYSCKADGADFSRAQKAMTNHSIPALYLLMLIPSIPGLKERLDAGMRILDIGCGTGALMIQLAKTFPKCEFVGIELDGFAVEDAQRHIRDNGVEGRVFAQLIDASSMKYDGKYDLINMAMVLHEIECDARYRSMSNCFKVLNDSGEIVILDFAYPESLQDFRKPEYTMGIMDQFYELTRGSELLSWTAKQQLLLGCGFKDPTKISLLGGSLEATHAKK
ncbi:MAG: class I SAM-dependent methyltransferase [Dehalococcoidia bacterium]|nr:class I SAM-dependent methyltransferase [Dehalococcoidia bacterium]